MSNGKAMVIRGTFGLIKKVSLCKINYFHNKKTYCHNSNKIKDELDLSNYTRKSNLKGKAGINTSKPA